MTNKFKLPILEDMMDYVKGFEHDSYLASLMYMVRHYKKLHSADSLTAGLPLKDDRLTPFLFVRAARRGGLHAKVVDRKIEKLSPHVLPAVALTKSNKAVIITYKDEENLHVFFPETGKLKKITRQQDFDEIYSGALILVRPATVFELGSDTIASGQSWFWDTIKQFWRIYAQVVFAAVLINMMALVSPLFVMNVYDRVVPNNAIETLWVLGIGVTIAYSFDFLLKVLRGYFIDIAGKGADILLAGRLFQQVLNIRLGVHGSSAGSFANQLREFETLRDFFTSATMVTFVDLPFVFLFIAIIASIGGNVAIVPLLAVPLVIIVSLFIQRPLRSIIEQSTHDLDAKHGHLVESINGLETIKSLNAQSRAQAKWEGYVSTVAKVGLRSRLLASIGLNFAGYVQQMVSVLVVFYGVFLIAEGEMSIGALIACTILSGRTMAPLSQAVALYTRFQQSRQALKSLNGIMSMEVERPDAKNFVHAPQQKGEIVFQDVSFTYPNAPLESLKGVNLHIRPGEKVGIIGRTGSGKSTILRLMLNLYNPTSGSILLDGLELRQLDPIDFRKHMGYIPQNLMLFSGTLRENILMGNPEASNERLAEICNLTSVSEFARRHPMGLDMPVGEWGGSLSGGQRQTVAIARAMLKKPNIVFMDEPTSELDNRTEELVLNGLKKEIEDKTVVIVTHKFSMLDLVDRLIVMDYGRIVADGPKETVLEQLKRRAVKGTTS
tara:strand:- start:11271 stop:13436 length:2166 start_codon:yes stop_codon:yes gene_type:complete